MNSLQPEYKGELGDMAGLKEYKDEYGQLLHNLVITQGIRATLEIDSLTDENEFGINVMAGGTSVSIQIDVKEIDLIIEYLQEIKRLHA